VAPQELQREERYIQRNIHATRKAFALEGPPCQPLVRRLPY
jgi:uncharacterized membrane protein (UPF0182 family)